MDCEKYFESDFRRSECEDAELRDGYSSAHAEIATDIEPNGIPDESHFFIIKNSFSSVDSKYKVSYLDVMDLLASSSNIWEEALDALEHTLLFMK